MRVEFPTINEENEAQFYERMVHATGAKVVFYMHGNSGSRAASHRIELYQLLREHGYHVFAFDYRGYADSMPPSPTETGLVRDAIAVYKYVTSVTKNPIFAWGHSLGTGVGCHTMAALAKLNIHAPRVLVLESPFNNIRDEVREHPFSKFFRHLPWFDYTVVDPMFTNNLRFESDKHIATFPQPVMILHAEDDMVVPFKLGHKVSGRIPSYQWAFQINNVIYHHFSCIWRHWRRDTSHGARSSSTDLTLLAAMAINTYAMHPSCPTSSISFLKRTETKSSRI